MSIEPKILIFTAFVLIACAIWEIYILPDGEQNGRGNMKSVTIRDKQGKILVKIIHRKNGQYDLIKTPEIDRDCDIEVRADDNSKVIFGGWDG